MKIKFLVALLFAVLLIGCKSASEDPDARFNSIKVGMALVDVEAILGEPSSKVEEISGHLVLWELEGGETIAITTDEDGKVTSTSRGGGQ